MSDERLGLPSASFLPRLRRCLGSWNAVQAITPERKKEIDDAFHKDAKDGTKRHDYIERYISTGKIPYGIDEAERNTCQWTKALLEKARKHLGYDVEETEVTQEKRYPLRDETLDIVSTGKFDYLELCVALESALIADWKTLYQEHTAPLSNWQMIQYACQIAQEYPWIQEFHLVLIQPNIAKEKQLQIAEFTREEVESFTKMILDTYREAERADAPRVAGSEQCEYCLARFDCADALKFSEQSAYLNQNPQKIDPQKLFRLQKAKKLIAELCKEYEARAIKALEVDPSSIDGYGLSNGKKKQVITDARKAWEVLSVILDADDFKKCCKLSVPDISDVLYRKLSKSGKITKTQCRTNVENVLREAELLDESIGNPSLKKV